MYYELYIDVLFLENFLMDYILLLITKHVLCSREPVWRICLAALAGALATCVVVAVRIPYTFIKYGLFYLIIPGIMLIVGLRIRKGPELARGMITLYIGGFLTGGIFSFLGQYAQVGSLFFALAIVSYYLASGALKMLSLLFHFGEIHCEVRLVYGERTCSAAAVIDTGNHLRDPVSGKAVSIITRHMAEKLMSLEELKSLRKIEYHTIGKGRGMLPVITIDSLWIEGEEQSYEKPMIAVSDDASFGTRYDMILNPDI